MRGLHWAGAKVGQAYSTITGGIQRVLNVATGGSWAAAGTAEYQAGLSDKFANWMSGQLDKGREFLGLETQKGLQVAKATEVVDLPEGLNDLPEGWSVEETQFKVGEKIGEDKILLRNPEGALRLEGSVRTNFELKVSASEQAISQTEALSLQAAGTPDTVHKYIVTDDGTYAFNGNYKPTDTNVTGVTKEYQQSIGSVDSKGARITPAKAKELSKLEKWGLGVSTAGGAVSLLQTAAGYGDDSISGGGLGPAEAALIPYESANVDWVNQGYAGQPLYGIGNTNYFQSLVDYSNTDPYYQYLTRLTA